jgi:methionyl aminopeptidase
MKAYEIVSDVLKLLARHATPGVDTLTLNNLAEKRIAELGGGCYNRNYKPNWAPLPFPAAVCISINDEIAHGIPNANRILQEGDIVNFDLGVIKDGECGDAALTVAVGQVDASKKQLLKIAKKALFAGIEQIKPGNKFRDIARAIEDTARHKGYVVNRNFGGHGIGADMHEDPFILMNLNYDVNDQKNYVMRENMLNGILKVGMKICLEPMLTEKDRYGRIEENGWTFKTRDGKPSAMFEHMLEVTETGCKILTTHID